MPPGQGTDHDKTPGRRETTATSQRRSHRHCNPRLRTSPRRRGPLVLQRSGVRPRLRPVSASVTRPVRRGGPGGEGFGGGAGSSRFLVSRVRTGEFLGGSDLLPDGRDGPLSSVLYSPEVGGVGELAKDKISGSAQIRRGPVRLGEWVPSGPPSSVENYRAWCRRRVASGEPTEPHRTEGPLSTPEVPRV